MEGIMENWTIDKVRRTFLDFFKAKGHTEVASSPLLPAEDKTLLFANAGMNQFKKLFLGLEKRSYTRACSAQKCVRAGGKHNDLENVGFTTRHHTFFEMLGNFSFGDYFKEDAIKYAWELVTEVFKLDKSRLYVTVFREDDEAEQLWLKNTDVDPKHIFRLDEHDNFWQMGDTGPCGPCSEIHYDLGEGFKVEKPFFDNGMPDFDCGRFVEIWNLVFMQFNRDESGKLTPLPKPNIDTGMGLERITSILNGKLSNYEIDVFQDLIHFTEDLLGKTVPAEFRSSLNVIADHARSTSFLIADTITPSNEGRGYVLRRIMRRAIRHGHKLGFNGLFFWKVCGEVIKIMGEHYPELVEKSELILNIVRDEESRFRQTLDKGLALLDDGIKEMLANGRNEFPGELVFKLYDTYGFPSDLTETILEEKGFTFNQAEYEKAMQEQKLRGKASWSAKMDSKKLSAVKELLDGGMKEPVFKGYDCESAEGKVIALFDEEFTPKESVSYGNCYAILDPIVFYAESGGQLADTGKIMKNGKIAANVVNAIKIHDIKVVQLEVLDIINKNDTVSQELDHERRSATRRNHSATHLLHRALKMVLGTHVNQAGSLVGPDRLRFDFNHFQAVTKEELKRVETEVNRMIEANSLQNTVVKGIEEAKKEGAMALFGEKYGENVRVVTMGESKELCGGTHVRATGDIGLFKIVKEEGIAAGVRRIEAVTGLGALALFQEYDETITSIAEMTGSEKSLVVKGVEKQIDTAKQLSRELKEAGKKLAAMQIASLAPVCEKEGTKIFAVNSGKNRAESLELVDSLKAKFDNAVIAVVGDDSGKALVIISATGEAKTKFHAGNILKNILAEFGGRGGGKPDMAQGGAPAVDFNKFSELLKNI